MRNPSEGLQYAIMSAEGELLGVERSEDAAIAEAKHLGARDIVIDQTLDPGDDFAPNAEVTPEQAWNKVARLRIDWRAVERMSRDEAWERIHGIFPRKKYAGRPEAKIKYDKPSGLVDALLGQNYKTAKTEAGGKLVDVKGLSMLPNVVWRRVLTENGRIPFPMAGKFERVNTCVGASAECAKSCLVYSGRNEADPYNALVKAARQTALFKEPVAFGRILLEACLRHAERDGEYRKASSKGPAGRYQSLIRLNVFQDIPWELVCPEIFGAVPVQFYDYTKVPGRKTPKNYDLTFSFSGRNVDAVDAELRRGLRAAVVFMVPRYNATTGKSSMPPSCSIGGREYKVYDGDISDARPLDPHPAAVDGAAPSALEPISSYRVDHETGGRRSWMVWGGRHNQPLKDDAGRTRYFPSKRAAEAAAEDARHRLRGERWPLTPDGFTVQRAIKAAQQGRVPFGTRPRDVPVVPRDGVRVHKLGE